MPLRISLSTQLACIWEATARKPGNVHRFADFDDVTYPDFIMSAAAIAPILAKAVKQPLGDTIFKAVEATRQVCRTNTNLGIILLLAPLASVPLNRPLFPYVDRILERSDSQDSIGVFKAIRLATPGGLGDADAQDVWSEPTLPLRKIMSLAAERDVIARQFANGFVEVFEYGIPALLNGVEQFGCLEDAIIHCHLSLLANFPDSLIARKCGIEQAAEITTQARNLVNKTWSSNHERRQAIERFDKSLRVNGNRLNPGTTADLVTACLFAALRDDKIQIPLPMPWSSG